MYEIYSRVERNDIGKKVALSDYEMLGSVSASARGEAIRKWYRDETEEEGKIRPPVTGDLIKSPEGCYFLLTKSGIWSSVTME